MILHWMLCWERVLIVIGNKFSPKLVSWMGGGVPGGLRRAFVIAANHAAWGVELALEHGVPELAVSLIRRHEDKGALDLNNKEDQLLAALQAADDQN